MFRKQLLATGLSIASIAGVAASARPAAAQNWPVECNPKRDCLDFVVECAVVLGGTPSVTQLANGNWLVDCDI